MSKALLKYIRLSPTKARLIAREIQGMNAELAIASLEFTPNKAARVISKVIASAVANGSYDAQSVSIVSCRVDAGPVLRRFRPRAKGRATPIRKPTSHILVEVGTQKAIKESKSVKDSKIAEKSSAASKESAKKPVKTTQKKTTQTSKKTKGEDK
ncbi:50S ribosomal protein L22 [Helicobacter cappadocius]|uniref:Large ribosomal subunit protein uL22 n=1 Tax=Helicobacter cappadocius TaxID=3063998 RepID=A0AA90PTV2_9HELI|nr:MULTISPECIES: 50S ribosomal protein L22 [unclassified Helicobacter]MDO7253517.1 50S ribosomal protein L22 [Helicobacter sp. faydin-H75]MDP2539444.1 50S ribosomal protein L22 [Helicobacter sp. faydin-H76]